MTELKRGGRIRGDECVISIILDEILMESTQDGLLQQMPRDSPVCVFFTINRSSTRRHPAHPVSVLILHPRKISSVVTSYDTEIMHRNAFDNAMSCPSTGYDRHNIHTSAQRRNI